MKSTLKLKGNKESSNITRKKEHPQNTRNEANKLIDHLMIFMMWFS